MSSAADLTRIALALPHAASKPHFDRTAFYVDATKGKTFATLAGDQLTANLVFTRDEQDMLCAAEPGIFAPVANKWGEKGWTVMTLAAADEPTLQSALTRAWKHAAPEKLHSFLPL